MISDLSVDVSENPVVCGFTSERHAATGEQNRRLTGL
jgi:hypothetical protein